MTNTKPDSFNQKCSYLLNGPSIIEQFLMGVVSTAIGIFVFISVYGTLNSVFRPVVTDFKVEHLLNTPNGITASGTLNKREPCELVVTNIYAWHGDKRSLLHSIQPLDTGGQMSTGPQTWGEYKLPPFKDPAPDKVQIIATHRCGLLVQETEYGVIEFKPIRSMK